MNLVINCMRKMLPIIFLLILSACTTLQNVSKDSKEYHSEGFVAIRNNKQYVTIGTENTDKPILLYLHGGPGGAETPLTNLYFGKLKKDFILVTWDQRGAGKSYDGKIPDEYQTVDSFVEDAKEVTEYLMKKFNKKKIYLVGNSWGSVLGMKLIYKYPEYYYAYVGTGQVVDMKENYKVSYDLLLNEAEEKGYKYREYYLKKIGRPTLDGSKKDSINKYFKFLTRRTRHSNTTFIEPQMRGLVLSGTIAYNPLILYLKFNGYKKLWEELDNLNLKKDVTKVDVPVYFALGRHDFHTPYPLAEEYFNMLEAPKKEIVWFENSAHIPEMDESKKFAELLKRVQSETLTGGN